MYHLTKQFIYVLAISSIWSCQSGVDINRPLKSHAEVFQQLLEENLEGPGNDNLGTSMTVIASDLDLHWSGSVGFHSKDKKNKLLPQQAFRIASVTKTFVAATILRMEEENLLRLDDPISKYIDTIFIEMLRDDGYQVDQILIHQCLTNTSSLFNYAQGGKSYLDRVFNDPKNVWDRKQQIEHAIEFGTPVGEPGDVYHYSDTGFILLGHIIEKISGEHYGAMMRSLLKFDGLDLNSTWLERLEEIPDSNLSFVPRYYDGEDYTHLDPSVDLFGGGGLMSTTIDLAHFLDALFNGQVFNEPSTLNKMIAEVQYGPDYHPHEDKKYLDYRKGLYRISIYGMDAFMHSGFWGTKFIHVPDINITIAVDALDGSTDRLLKKVILYLKKAKDQNP